MTTGIPSFTWYTWFAWCTQFTWQCWWRRWQQLYLIDWWISCNWCCVLSQVLFFPRSFLLVLHTKIFSGRAVENFLFFLLIQTVLSPALNIQLSMVLWAMVNCQSINIVVKILNTCSTGLFEEDIIIASSANKHIWKLFTLFVSLKVLQIW